MKKRVLIIDDEKQLNQINQKILQQSGLVTELHIATNGQDAIDYVCARIDKGYPLPDIIITDLHMPVMDGFEFIEAFRKLPQQHTLNTEIVVFTSSSSMKDRQRAIDLGIRHFLNKPYLLRGFTDIVKNHHFRQFDRVAIHSERVYKTVR